jgi:hypothetical protein
VSPVHQRPHEPSAFVVARGGYELHLAGGKVHVPQGHDLVQQGRRGHHAVAVHDDGARLPTRLRILDNEPVVDRIFRFAPVDEQLADLRQVSRRARPQDQTTGKEDGRRHGR